MTLLASRTIRLYGAEAIAYARAHDLKLSRLPVGDEPARDDITLVEALDFAPDTLFIDVDEDRLPIVSVPIVQVVAAAALLDIAVQADVERALKELDEARARIVAQVTAAAEFDVPRLAAARQELDRQIARLNDRLPTILAAGAKAALDHGDRAAVEQAKALLGDAAPKPSQYAINLQGIPGVVVSQGAAPAGPSSHLADYAKQYSADLVKQITAQARGKINLILTAGAAGSSTPQDIRDALGEVLTEADRPTGFFGKLARQVDTVHRTETGMLYEAASRERMSAVAEAAPFEMGKRWIATLGRVFPRDHQSMHGTIVGMEEQFTTPYGNTCDGPLDAALPAVDAANCRCSLAAVRMGPRVTR